MALRVLLADESTTIKKVIQLALQDFAVEVKSVHSGVDVMEVAKVYTPDIIFADVLLPKKNGYEISAELKSDPQLSAIPIVIMWSSFMDLDEKAFAKSQANARLEKPFDVENLRAIVSKLVVRAQSSRLAPHLQFPNTFADPLRNEEIQKREAALKTPAPQQVRQAPPPTSVPTVPSASANQTREQNETLQSRILQKEQELEREHAAAIRAHAEKLHAEALRQAQAATPTAPSVPITPPTPPTQDPSATQTKSAWNMDSFSDINEFAAQTNPAIDDDDDDKNEVQMVQLHSLRKSSEGQASGSAGPAKNLRSPANLSLNTPQDSAANNSSKDEDQWARKDLSAYRVQLPPVTLPEQNELDPSALSRQAPTHRRADQGLMLEPPPGFDTQSGEDDQLTADRSSGVFEFAEQHSNLSQGLTLESPAPGFHSANGPALHPPAIDLHSPELQRMIQNIVQAELQKMIQQVVPELATKLIQAELSRLLSDSEHLDGNPR